MGTLYVCMYVISTCLSEAVNVLMYDQACKCMYVCFYIHIMTLWKTRCTIIFMYVCMYEHRRSTAMNKTLVYVCMGSVYDNNTMFNCDIFFKKFDSYSYDRLHPIRASKDVVAVMAVKIFILLPSYIHTYICTYIHTYIHTYMYMLTYILQYLRSFFIFIFSGGILSIRSGGKTEIYCHTYIHTYMCKYLCRP